MVAHRVQIRVHHQRRPVIWKPGSVEWILEVKRQLTLRYFGSMSNGKTSTK